MEIAFGIFGAVGTLASIAALWYAINCNRDRKRMEALLRATVVAVTDSLQRINKRSQYAKSHFDTIRKSSLTLPDGDPKSSVLTHACLGRADVTATVDSHAIIQNQLRAILSTAINVDTLPEAPPVEESEQPQQ